MNEAGMQHLNRQNTYHLKLDIPLYGVPWTLSLFLCIQYFPTVSISLSISDSSLISPALSWAS